MDLFKHFLNDKTISQIMQDKKNNSASSGYLFFSIDNLTNMQYAKTLALGLLCNDCGCLTCPNCLKVQQGVHPDLIEFPKNKSFNVQDAKDIVEEATKKPMLCEHKVIVIHNIDNSSEEAQNKILKTIEEPPKNVYFIVTASSLDKVLPTIKSRLVKKEIMPFSRTELSQILNEHSQKQSFELALIKGGGYVGKTLDIVENEQYMQTYLLCKDVVCKLKSSADVLSYLPEKLDKTTFTNILEILLSMFRDLLMINQNKENKQVFKYN